MSLSVSLTEALDLTTPTGRAMAGLLSVFAVFEHEILRERIRAKRGVIAEARLQGKHLGRPAVTVGKMAGQIRKAEPCRASAKPRSPAASEIGRTSVRRILAARQA